MDRRSQPSDEDDELTCEGCGATLYVWMESCPYCSESEEAETVPCPECGAEIDENSQRCPICEAWITIKSPSRARSMTRVTIWLLLVVLGISIALWMFSRLR